MYHKIIISEFNYQFNNQVVITIAISSDFGQRLRLF